MAEPKRRPVRKSAQRKEGKAAVRKTSARKPQPREVFLRTGERATFRRCRQKWWWAWREGLTPPFRTGSLWFGEGIHFALAGWYKLGDRRGPHPAKTFDKWVGLERRRIFTQPNPQVEETEVVDARDLGVGMLEHYVDRYGKDEDWSVITVEQSFQARIPLNLTDYDMGVLEIVYGITFDGVARGADGRIWLLEHKTAKQISTAHLPLDDQAGSYWAFATGVLRKLQLIKTSEDIHGIMYNFLRKAMPDKRETNEEGMRLNKDGSVSKSQPAAHFLREPVYRFPGEIATQIKRIQDEATEMMLVRKGILPVTKNPTKDCSWDCAFFSMCQLHEAGDDWESYKEAVYQVEDPYAKHRKSAAE